MLFRNKLNIVIRFHQRYMNKKIIKFEFSMAIAGCGLQYECQFGQSTAQKYNPYTILSS